MIFFTFIGLVAVVSIITVLFLLTLETFKNKRALKWFRIGDEVKKKGLVIPTTGIIISINHNKRELLILQIEHGWEPIFNKVSPAEYVPTGVTYSREELKRHIPAIEALYSKKARRIIDKLTK